MTSAATPNTKRKAIGTKLGPSPADFKPGVLHTFPSPRRKPMHRRAFVQSAALLAGLAAPPVLRARQKSPNKPIKFVVPFAAGGGGDVVARMLAQRLHERIHHPIVVENRSGGG